MTDLEVNWPISGRYIVAVSGGADSMALLDLLTSTRSSKGYDLIVAHFDHGMRRDSPKDMDLVQASALDHQLEFRYTRARLVGASEAHARRARYQWLEETRITEHADAIITAHHQDDLIETSLLHLARGTGRRGLAPMANGPVMRPLLFVSRAKLRAYARSRTLGWREDKTNTNITNPRNFVRHELLPKATLQWRQAYLENIGKMLKLNNEVDQLLGAILTSHKVGPNGYAFSRTLVRDLALPETEELLVAAALSLDPTLELDRRVVSEVALFAKTGRPGTRRPLRKQLFTGVQTDTVRVYYMGI